MIFDCWEASGIAEAQVQQTVSTSINNQKSPINNN